MQGVRTTRGCVSCRLRKKGCDLKTPACERCQRLNVTCAYEERRWVFVGQEDDQIETATKEHGQITTRPLSALNSLSQSSLVRTNSALQTEARFWSIYLPQEDTELDGSIGGVLAAPWIPTVRALAEEDSGVRTALQVCVYAGLNWAQQDYALLQRATQLYAQALRNTNKALQDPAAAQTDNVLALCRLLSLFELFCHSPQQNQTNGWQSHVNGTCRIVRLRGRERHLSGHGLPLYDGVRMTAVIHGLLTRQPNSFTTLAWHLPQRTLRDELFDLISVVPELLQQIDSLGADVARPMVDEGRNTTLQLSRELIQRCLLTADKFCAWESKAVDLCRKLKSTPGYEAREEAAGGPDGRSLLFGVCKSHGDGFFFICAQYWASCTTLYSSVQRFSLQLSSSLETASLGDHIPQLPDWLEPESHALNIAHTASHWFRPQSGLWSAQCAAFPLGTVLYYYARTGRRESTAFKTVTAAFADNKAGAVLHNRLESVLSLDERSGG